MDIQQQLELKTDEELETMKNECAEYVGDALRKNEGLEQAKEYANKVFKLIKDEQAKRTDTQEL